jgi:hypothetical protein
LEELGRELTSSNLETESASTKPESSGTKIPWTACSAYVISAEHLIPDTLPSGRRREVAELEAILEADKG